MKNRFKKIETTLYLIVILQFPRMVFAQDKMGTQFNRDTLITTARIMMETVRYCAVITLDTTGHPDVRIMDPFSPDDDMVVWLGTNVVIKGQAYMVDASLKKQTYWKKEWSRFYSENKSNYTLIKVIPDKLEIIDYQHGIFGDPKTWAVPFVKFNPTRSN
jgi:general stress protein 26